MKKFYLIPMMVVLTLLCGCYSDNDEPLFPQIPEEEEVLTEDALNQMLEGRLFALTKVVPLSGSGDSWTENDIIIPGINSIYDFLLPYVNRYFWSKNGQMFVDFNYKSSDLREKFGDDFMDFSKYMAENNGFGQPFFIATTLKYNETTHVLSTSNQAFDREEIPGMRYVIESFKDGVLVVRTEYNEPYVSNITGHRVYYKATTEIPTTSRDFGSKSEFLEFFDQIVSLWAESRGKVKPTL